MLNTFIQNKGQTQTILHHNRRSRVNEIKWDANYDGVISNISVSSNTDGMEQRYDFKLDNQDLETILNIPSVDIPLHNRLQKDFVDSAFKYEPVVYHVELPRKDYTPIYNNSSKSDAKDSYLSSPLPNEELILPLTIDEKGRKKHSLRRHRLQKKSHRTYRAYKKPKSRRFSKSAFRSRSKPMFSSKNI